MDAEPQTTPYRNSDAEYWAMRRLLAEGNAAAGWPLNWTFARLDNWRYASWDRTDDEFRQLAHLWRDGGRLVGFTILEGPDDWLTLQVRPEARDGEPAMLDWAEAHFRGTRAELELLCADDDRRRMALLAARGYTDRGPVPWLAWVISSSTSRNFPKASSSSCSNRTSLKRAST